MEAALYACSIRVTRSFMAQAHQWKKISSRHGFMRAVHEPPTHTPSNLITLNFQIYAKKTDPIFLGLGIFSAIFSARHSEFRNFKSNRPTEINRSGDFIMAHSFSVKMDPIFSATRRLLMDAECLVYIHTRILRTRISKSGVMPPFSSRRDAQAAFFVSVSQI